MAAAHIPLLLLALLGGALAAQGFYGDSVHFSPLKTNPNGTIVVPFSHRLHGRSLCADQSTLECGNGNCVALAASGAQQTDMDTTVQERWCQSEGRGTATVAAGKKSLTLSATGCCWEWNINGKTNWTSLTEMDLGTRSDTTSYNSCPVTASVSTLSIPQNCFSQVRLLAHDPDGDEVRCRFSSGATAPANVTLDEATCTLVPSGLVPVGSQVFEVTLEDFPSKNITLTYADGTSVFRRANDADAPPLCKVKLQFLLEILPSFSKCHRPMFLSKTPLHGEVLQASVDEPFVVHAEAQVQDGSIHNFQVSGPQTMTKLILDRPKGNGEVKLLWVPGTRDLYSFVPFCLTAETNGMQSEMRCFVVMVTQASIIQGKATVKCSPNKMTVLLDKASMPDIDVNFLRLRDPSCTLTSNNTQITGSMSFSTCGTKLEDRGDFLSFENEISSFELPDEVIVRRTTVKIAFSCQFPKAISISNFFQLKRSDYIFTEAGFGSYSYAFDVFRDSNFTVKVDSKAYPVEIKLLETIYMGIQAESALPNVRLFVESCKATPDNNPDNALSYDLIKNGCTKDETLSIHQSNSTTFNFEVQAFKFNGNFDQVYITCSVIMCEASSPFSRCAQGCLSDPSRRRRRRDNTMETLGHYITQGPFEFVGADLPMDTQAEQNNLQFGGGEDPAVNAGPAASPDDQGAEGPRTSAGFPDGSVATAVLGCAFALSLVVMAAFFLYFRRRGATGADRDTLIEYDES